MKTLATLDDLTLDPSNANLGTERGRALLAEAIDTCGLGRSIVVDKHGVVIAGNKTLEAARATGAAMTVVQTSGQELVVVQRRDLDLLEQPQARQLSYYDNRVAQVDLQWSPRQIQADLLAGVDLSDSFFPEELDRLTFVDTLPALADDVAGEPVEMVELSGPLTAVPDDAEDEPTESEPKPPKEPKPHFAIVFDNIVQQVRWTALMRALRERHPDVPSQAARIALHLTDQGFV